jgi:hypothetical protein
MHQGDILIGIAALLVLIVGPLLFGLRGSSSPGLTTVGAVPGASTCYRAIGLRSQQCR